MTAPGWQAACLQPLLLAKVQAWALASGGCFAVRGSPLFQRYDAAVAGEAAPVLKFAEVKSASRAIEKAVRAYGQVRRRRRQHARKWRRLEQVPVHCQVGHDRGRCP